MSTGLEAPLCYVNDVTGSIFFPMVLVAVWIIFAVGGYFTQKRSVGVGDLPQCVAVAGFTTCVFAFILRLVKDSAGDPCLVGGTALAICIVVAVIGVLWLLFSQD